MSFAVTKPVAIRWIIRYSGHERGEAECVRKLVFRNDGLLPRSDSLHRGAAAGKVVVC